MKETVSKLIQIIQSQEVEESSSRKDELWKNTIAISKRKQQKQKLVSITISITTVAAVVLGFLIYNSQLNVSNLSYVPLELVAKQMYISDELSEVTLFVMHEEFLEVENKASIIVSDEGDILVGKQRFAELLKKGTGKYAQLIVPKGRKSSLTLSDNSKLEVNSGTKVIFPVNFEDNRREIFVDGEAYIKVSPDNKKPFVVKTKNDFKVEVLGTSFNICTYDELDAASVVLVDGSVSIKDNKANELILAPNQMVSVSSDGLSGAIPVDAQDYIGWTNDILVLHSQSLKNVVERLEIHFGENVDIEEDIHNIKISGKLNLNSNLSSILEGLTNITITPISYFKDEDGLHIIKKK